MPKKKSYKIIKEGLAMARFDLVAEDMPLVDGGKPFSFDVEEPEQENDELYAKLFRCLSATTTQSRFFDFSAEGVLKAAVHMFEGKTIFANHNMDVTRWKGVTKGAVWDDKNEPNGVNALFVLDRAADPLLVRGVETGALKSASATLWFSYKRSHPELKYFYDHLGEEVDGETVRFVVTGISNVGEMSIVWEGEDRYAKSFNAGSDPEDNFNGEEPMEFSAEFLKQLSLSGEPEAEAVEAAVAKKIAGLESDISTLKPEAEAGKKHLAGTREKAVALYKAAKGEEAKESFITNVIEKADLETARSFVDEYQGAVEDAVPLTCPKCGEKLTRRSSASAGDEGGKSVDVRNYKIK
jgi:hypothetical protein